MTLARIRSKAYIYLTLCEKISRGIMRRTFIHTALLLAVLLFNCRESSAMEFGLTDTKADLVKVYPNPVVADANIRIQEDVDLENTSVSIVFYNLIGSEVFEIRQIKDYDQKIYRDDFKNAGIYFYQLRIDGKIVSTGRITVK